MTPNKTSSEETTAGTRSSVGNRGPDGLRYYWGRILAVHEISGFEIIEDDQGHFHPYDQGRDSHHSYPSLDRALVAALAERYDPAGANTKADTYFWRAICADALSARTGT